MTEEAMASEISSIRSMAQALRWAAARTPPAVFIDAVTQDEFTIDVVVRSGDSSFVVFDTT